MLLQWLCNSQFLQLKAATKDGPNPLVVLLLVPFYFNNFVFVACSLPLLIGWQTEIADSQSYTEYPKYKEEERILVENRKSFIYY